LIGSAVFAEFPVVANTHTHTDMHTDMRRNISHPCSTYDEGLKRTISTNNNQHKLDVRGKA